MVRRSKNLATGILIRMQRPRARLGTNRRRPPSRIDHASLLYRFPFRFSIGNKKKELDSFAGIWLRTEWFPSMDDGSRHREGRGGIHLLRRSALRYIALRMSNGFVLKKQTHRFEKKEKKKKIKEMTCETLVIALFYRIVTRESGGGAIIGYSFRWSTRNCPSIVADRTAESISIYMDEHKL